MKRETARDRLAKAHWQRGMRVRNSNHPGTRESSTKQLETSASLMKINEVQPAQSGWRSLEELESDPDRAHNKQQSHFSQLKTAGERQCRATLSLGTRIDRRNNKKRTLFLTSPKCSRSGARSVTVEHSTHSDSKLPYAAAQCCAPSDRFGLQEATSECQRAKERHSPRPRQ